MDSTLLQFSERRLVGMAATSPCTNVSCPVCRILDLSKKEAPLTWGDHAVTEVAGASQGNCIQPEMYDGYMNTMLETQASG